MTLTTKAETAKAKATASAGRTRVLTAIIGIPLFLFPLYKGGIWFLILVTLIAALAQIELIQLQGDKKWSAGLVMTVILGSLLAFRGEITQWSEISLFIAVLIVLETLWKGPAGHPWKRVSISFGSVVYPVLFLSLLPLIRDGLQITMGDSVAFRMSLLMIALIWVCDSAAYYSGRAFGKTKLAPEISPNKTVEGAIGGVTGAILVAGLAKILFLPSLTWMDVFAFGLIAGVVGQLGDLVESAIKREAGVKDSGSLLPGHGGFLDRFDSLSLAVPAYYLYLASATTYL